jgi:hypothetical protein
MSWTAAIPIVGSIIESFNGWRERRHEIKLKQHEVKIKEVEVEGEVKVAKATAEIQMLHQRATADIDWELLHIQNAGWRDDGVTVYTLVLLTALFVPYTQPYVRDGFEILGELPMWFQVMVAIVWSAPFGVRVFDNFQKLVRT